MSACAPSIKKSCNCLLKTSSPILDWHCGGGDMPRPSQLILAIKSIISYVTYARQSFAGINEKVDQTVARPSLCYLSWRPILIVGMALAAARSNGKPGFIATGKCAIVVYWYIIEL